MEARVVRPNGLLVMLVLVVVGVGVTAGYLRWKAPEVRAIVAGRKQEIAETPTTAEGRLSKWLVFGAPQIHHRLEMMRFSAERPWLVTHAVGADRRDLAIHGIDLTQMKPGLARIVGTTVEVRLPKPTLLGRGALVGDNAAYVPVAPSDALAPDELERADYLVHFALDGLSQALERDIPGAKLAVVIGPQASFGEIDAGADED